MTRGWAEALRAQDRGGRERRLDAEVVADGPGRSAEFAGYSCLTTGQRCQGLLILGLLGL
jgi:hypothetical protein